MSHVFLSFAGARGIAVWCDEHIAWVSYWAKWLGCPGRYNSTQLDSMHAIGRGNSPAW